MALAMRACPPLLEHAITSENTSASIDRLEGFVPKTHIGGSLARIAPVAWSFADTVRPTTCASSMPAFTGGSHVDRPWSCHDCRS